ncbi:hypothetical protein ACSFCM_18645 [Enterococcus gilvus]
MKTVEQTALIKLYELIYLSRDFFLEQLLGSGQRTAAAEGLDRFCFYIERSTGRIPYDYYISAYPKDRLHE